MASSQPPEMRHRVKVRILVILASLLAFLAIFTSWIDRQLLDTNEWVNTSGRLLEDKEISDALATYSVDQLYANVDVTKLVKKRLPDDLQQGASPVSAGKRGVGDRSPQGGQEAAAGRPAAGRLARLGGHTGDRDPCRQASFPIDASPEPLAERQPGRAHAAGRHPRGQERGGLQPEREGGARPPADRLPARRSARPEKTGRQRDR